MLRVEGLSVRYGAIQAVTDVDLTVQAGSLVALLGRNGAGKSSVLRAIAGVERRLAGSVFFDDLPLEGGAAKVVRRGVVLVPEGRRIFTDLTVQENLTLGGYIHARDPERLRRGLDRVCSLFPILAERRRQSGGSLSGGEQQMLAIGRALMSTPRLLLLDEPSMGLSPRVTTELYAAITQLRLDGLAVLLVEQKLQAILREADQAHVFAQGRIVLSGRGEDVARDPALQAAYFGGEA